VNESVAHARDVDETVDFAWLDDLRRYLERLLNRAVASLTFYYDSKSGGFFHVIDPEAPPPAGKFSKASTATCLSFLGAAGLLHQEPWQPKLRDLRRTILLNTTWSSAGLPPDNPFTTSFLLEAVHALSVDSEDLEAKERRVLEAKLEALNRELTVNHGAIHIEKYPPTAFLTQSAVRVLKKWEALDDAARDAVEQWTWNHLHEESVLLASHSDDADVFELIYSVLTASLVAPLDEMTPQQRGVLHYALDQFFSRQTLDGGWPRSRPLFLYPEIGYAYCFDYELLVQVLSDPQLMPVVVGRLRNFETAARRLDDQKYPLTTEAYGWSSGHHGRRRFAESWSTASALHFCFMLRRLVADAIRQTVFDYADVDYARPAHAAEARLPDSLLDSKVGPGTPSLKRALQKSLLEPLIKARDYVDDGRALPATVPASAILYGAPGTSKTKLAEMIADCLSWPLLKLDPSHLTRRGLDQIHAEAHRLFSMLQSCERVVVFLDEFDELVREREQEGESEVRFLTTAMLPKLAALSERRRVVYLLATNHLERFDVAIRREGRFDLIVPVMPPTAREKFRWWPALREAFDVEKARDEESANHTRKQIEDLTFAECERLVRRLSRLPKGETFASTVQAEYEHATLSQPVAPQPVRRSEEEAETWKARLQLEREHIRLPETNDG
jgi:hypothetical protein